MKKLLLTTLFFMPTLLFSQTYECKFSKYENGHDNNPQKVFHSLNSSTAVNYYDQGYKVELETIYEDGEFSAYITIYKNGNEILMIDYWDAQPNPSFFDLNYHLAGFQGECYCEKK